MRLAVTYDFGPGDTCRTQDSVPCSGLYVGRSRLRVFNIERRQIIHHTTPLTLARTWERLKQCTHSERKTKKKEKEKV